MKLIIIGLSFFAIASIGVIGYIIGTMNCIESEIKLVPIDYFKSGDTLLPSYVCPDTLIVIDASGLNRAWALQEQGICDYSEYQLDSIYHTYANDPQEYQIRLEEDSTYIYNGSRLVGVMPYDSTQSFDKIMLKDNL